MGPFLPGIAEGVINRLGQPQGEPGQGVGREESEAMEYERGPSSQDPADRSGNR
jgi:hypothetical protein